MNDWVNDDCRTDYVEAYHARQAEKKAFMEKNFFTQGDRDIMTFSGLGLILFGGIGILFCVWLIRVVLGKTAHQRRGE